MDSLTLTLGCGFQGVAKGTAASPSLRARLSRTSRVQSSGAGWEVYDSGDLTLAASAILQIDLTTGLLNPLGESISGSLKFSKVYGVIVEHAVTSTASGITVFGGGTNEFQGPLAAGNNPTLVPGAWLGFGMPATKAGWTVDTTHKRIDVTNADGAIAATVRVFVLGKI